MASMQEEVAASMARIKALQAALAGGGAAEEEEEEEGEPYDYEANQTEEDEKWREEQEREWERQQALEKEEAAKAKAAEAATAAAGGSADGAAASQPASTAAAAASPAQAAAASSSSSSAAVAGSVGPHQFSGAQLTEFLLRVRNEVKQRAVIFEKKGWTKAEVSSWLSEVDSSFAAASAALSAAKLDGAAVAKWSLESDEEWQKNLGVKNAYHRAALAAHWKEELRNWQAAQQKK